MCASALSVWAANVLGDIVVGTHLALHIFVAEKGDYYDIDDGLPQHAAYPAKG